MIPFHRVDVSEPEIEGVVAALRSGWLTSGPVVKEFEQAFAGAVGARHAIAVASATMGALVALDAAWGWGSAKHQTVVMPTWTFSGPGMMAHRLGARVVLADVDRETLMMTPATAEQALSVAGLAPYRGYGLTVMPTHFAGRRVDLAGFREAWPQALLVDDAAHRLPHQVDPNADLTLFSLYATKTVPAGEGGVVTTPSDLRATEIRRYRLHGFDRPIEDRYTNAATGWRYDIAVPGWKANMTDPTAALALGALRLMDERRALRASIARRYVKALFGVVDVPPMTDDHSWHLFVIRVFDRDGFVARMAQNGVQCSVHFQPLHRLTEWQSIVVSGRWPVAETEGRLVCSLPIFPTMTEEEVDQVIAAVKASL